MKIEYFKTSDLLLASFLLAKQAQYIGVEQGTNTSRCFFVFEGLANCEALKRDFLNNGQVSARELFSRREELVSEMKNGNRY